MNMEECIWNHIHLTDKQILGHHRWNGKLDLINIVLLGLPKVLPKQDEGYELHRLLTTLLPMDMSAKEKLGIMEKEYNMSVDDELESEMNIMCNLGRGAVEYGIDIGEKRGIDIGEKRINNLNKKLREEGRISDLFRSLDDPAFQEQLLKEYNI